LCFIQYPFSFFSAKDPQGRYRNVFYFMTYFVP